MVVPRVVADGPRAGAGDVTVAAVVFDWDGTAVPERHADASAVRARVEALSAAGVHLFVVSGTHVGNVDGQLAARPAGPGCLHLCLNRGSEVFEVTGDAPALVAARAASPQEDEQLDLAAALTVERLHDRSIEARVVSQRLNRRKIDLIPDPAWADPPKSSIGELLVAVSDRLHHAGIRDLAEVVEVATGAAHDAGLADPRITSDVKHIEIGLTDKADSARWAAAWLADRGITGSLVMVGGDEFGPIGGVAGSDSLMLVAELARAQVISVGVEPGGVPPEVLHLGGGPDRFLHLLDNQLARRADQRVPWIDEDPAWVLELPHEPGTERAEEALTTLSNGSIAARGDGATATSLVAVNGAYSDGPQPRLLPGPNWAHLGGADTHRHMRLLLDLRTGVLATADDSTGLRAVRFVSAADPHALALRAESEAPFPGCEEMLTVPHDTEVQVQRRRRGRTQLAATLNDAGFGITMGARERLEDPDHLRVDRLTTWTAGVGPAWTDVTERLDALDAVGFDRLLAEHRVAWAQRWANAEVTITGSEEDQLAARFSLFHLLSSAPDMGEAAVGARGLTGTAYGGHVFWDADVFVLPALAATRPAAARAMLEYRIRRLPQAQAAAAEAGARGARFPWESAADGTDVTPPQVVGHRGEVIPILTGIHEIHIVADVAWAAAEYAAWTGDAAFLDGAGRDLIVETARYWASRTRRDADGRAHIDAVMGPDEYHEVVDDNAYTNIMARWNLRQAADLVETAGTQLDEAAAWRDLAASLVDGYDPTRGLHEQFAGYWNLEPLRIADFAQPPVAADVLLGPDRIAGSQLIKQADVLMAHHLVPGEVTKDSLSADLEFYGPRTAHGSSLSPAIHASLLARAGKPDDALELFRLAVRLDLDDLTGTTVGGLHFGTLGGVWQALAYGFAGLRPQPGWLEVDPCLPSAWEALTLRLRFHGQPIRVRVDHRAITIDCQQPFQVRVAHHKPRQCNPPSQTFIIEGSTP